MTELPEGFKTSFNVPAAIDAADLLRYYSFDLGGCPVEQLLGHWLTQYSADWIRLAVVEALYQGRYKAISVEQILVMWQRRQQAFCHFNREFERLVCNKIPHQLHSMTRLSSRSNPSERALPLSHRQVGLQLSNSQALSLQTPAKIPPLRITPAANGSSASRLLNLVSPTQAASQPLPPFPVDHIDQPGGEPDRTPCQPVTELRTLVSSPAPEVSVIPPEPPQGTSEGTPPASAPSKSASAVIKPLSPPVASSGLSSNPPQPTPEPQEPEQSQPPVTKAPNPFASLTQPPTPASPIVPCAANRLPQDSEERQDSDPLPPKLAALASPLVQGGSERSLDLTRQSPALSPEEMPPELQSEAVAPLANGEAKPEVELPIWKRIQSDPMLTSPVTATNADTAIAPAANPAIPPSAIVPDQGDDPEQGSLVATRNGKERFLEQIKQGIRFSLDLGFSNRAMHPKLRLLLSQMYHLDWTIFDFNQPIHQFVPALDSPDFHGKLRAVAQSTEPDSPIEATEVTPAPSPIEQKA